MGLHLCYELSLPKNLSEAAVKEQVSALREHALTLPFEYVSEMVHLTDGGLVGPWPTRGLTYTRLENVVHLWAVLAREDLYRRSLGLPEETDGELTRVVVPPDTPTVAHAFAVAPGHGSEPATFGLVQLAGSGDEASPWWWYCFCKTQYASIVSDEHLLACHGSLVTLLDASATLGFDVVVRDETGYWESRDPQQLFERVAEMNRIVARFAGTFTDAMRDAGGDSHEVQGAIFEHPDFERLETEE